MLRKDFAVREVATYLPKFGALPTPPYFLDPIDDPLFSLVVFGVNAIIE